MSVQISVVEKLDDTQEGIVFLILIRRIYIEQRSVSCAVRGGYRIFPGGGVFFLDPRPGDFFCISSVFLGYFGKHIDK